MSGISPTMEAALKYAGLGIAVFPLRPKTKQPYGRTVGLKMASADVGLTRERWAGRARLPLKPDAESRAEVTAGPSANVAIATGAPAGFWVLDEDGPDAAAWIAARQAEHGPLPDTVEQQTARGRHRCFAWDEAAQAAGIGNRSALSGAPIDVRGDGGYIVAPPSIHPGDAKKGVPPGWVYRWRPGHAPWEMAFAPAPEWLIAVVKPPAAEPVAPPRPHVRVEGRASPYGEAALTRACGEISSAKVGSRDTTLYRNACSIARLVAGGEIEESYARSALESAGRVHVPSVGTEAQLVRQVARALDWGATRPRSAERDRASPRRADRDRSETRPVAKPAMTTIRSSTGSAIDAEGLWREADPGDVGLVRAWLKLRHLPHAGVWAAAALGRLRAHARAPLDSQGARGPALLAPLTLPGESIEAEAAPTALAVLPLTGGHRGHGADRFTHFIGETAGRGCVLAPAEPGGAILVAIDLQDAWALACDLEDTDDVMGVVVTPTLSAFCGGALGDSYGRVDPATPMSDPALTPWTLPGMSAVFLAVRDDLHPPELKVRKFGGGTMRVELQGHDAARFCGSLAEQAWRRSVTDSGGGAHAVRLLSPTHAPGFNSRAGA